MAIATTTNTASDQRSATPMIASSRSSVSGSISTSPADGFAPASTRTSHKIWLGVMRSLAAEIQSQLPALCSLIPLRSPGAPGRCSEYFTTASAA